MILWCLVSNELNWDLFQADVFVYVKINDLFGSFERILKLNISKFYGKWKWSSTSVCINLRFFVTTQRKLMKLIEKLGKCCFPLVTVWIKKLFWSSETYRRFLLAADKCYVMQIRECKLSTASSFVDQKTVEGRNQCPFFSQLHSFYWNDTRT